MTQPRLKKLLRAIVVLTAALAVVWGLLLAVKDSIFRSLAVQRIRRATGLETRIGQMKVGLASARVTVRDLQVENPPNFGSGALLTVPELHAVMDSADAAAGKLHFKELRLNLAELNVVTDTNGRVNVEAFARLKSLAFGGIDKLDLTLGKVNFTDLRQPQGSATIDLGIQGEVVTNLHNSADVKAMVWRIALREMLRAPTQTQGGGWQHWLEKLGTPP